MRKNTKKSRTWRNWSPPIALLSLLLVVPLAGCGDASSTNSGGNQKDPAASEVKEVENPPSKEELEEEFGEVDTPESELADITEEVTVSQVIDGDTIVVSGENGEETVQLALSDTPESILPDGSQDEFFGFKSNEFTTARLQGSTVRLERAGNQTNEDGHTIGYIWLKSGVDHANFNKLLLQEGMARLAEETDSNSKYLDEFREAESQAKAEQKYIWSVEGYVTDQGFDPSRVN